MKHLILALLLIASIVCQAPTDPTFLRKVLSDPTSDSPGVAATLALSAPSAPDASQSFDTASSDQIQPEKSSIAGVTGVALPLSIKNPTYDNANNAWNYLQRLGGGCCNNCNKICGMGIKIYKTQYYLTNQGNHFRFLFSSTGSPNSNQIFTLGQNVDCTWSISNNGQYVSLSSIFGSPWVGTSSSIGSNERWYIERSGAWVYVQSASSQYNYWRASAPWYFLGYSAWWGTRLTFEYFPCDKTLGWNW